MTSVRHGGASARSTRARRPAPPPSEDNHDTHRTKRRSVVTTRAQKTSSTSSSPLSLCHASRLPSKLENLPSTRCLPRVIVVRASEVLARPSQTGIKLPDRRCHSSRLPSEPALILPPSSAKILQLRLRPARLSHRQIPMHLARSTTNSRMIYCTDGEFHHDTQCGPRKTFRQALQNRARRGCRPRQNGYRASLQ